MRSWLPSWHKSHVDEYNDYNSKITQGTECECDLSQALLPQREGLTEPLTHDIC